MKYKGVYIDDHVDQRSACQPRRYGAVIVNNDEIMSTGYNGVPTIFRRGFIHIGGNKRYTIKIGGLT